VSNLERGLGRLGKANGGAGNQAGEGEDLAGKKLAGKAKAGAVSLSGGQLVRLWGSGCREKWWNGSITCRVGGTK